MVDIPKIPLRSAPKPESKPQQQITVQFFLMNGAVVSWPVPGDAALFNFPMFVQSIRAQGYWLQPDAYIPESKIVMIGLGYSGLQPSVRIQQPEHATRQ